MTKLDGMHRPEGNSSMLQPRDRLDCQLHSDVRDLLMGRMSQNLQSCGIARGGPPYYVCLNNRCVDFIDVVQCHRPKRAIEGLRKHALKGLNLARNRVTKKYQQLGYSFTRGLQFGKCPTPIDRLRYFVTHSINLEQAAFCLCKSAGNGRVQNGCGPLKYSARDLSKVCCELHLRYHSILSLNHLCLLDQYGETVEQKLPPSRGCLRFYRSSYSNPGNNRSKQSDCGANNIAAKSDPVRSADCLANDKRNCRHQKDAECHSKANEPDRAQAGEFAVLHSRNLPIAARFVEQLKACQRPEGAR